MAPQGWEVPGAGDWSGEPTGGPVQGTVRQGKPEGAMLTEAGFSRVLRYRKGDRWFFLISIPKRRVVQPLGLQGGEGLRVLVDTDSKRIVYELLH